MSGAITHPCGEGLIKTTKANAPCAPKAGPWILASTILGTSMAFIDETAVTVALPAIQTSLDATAVGAQMVVEAYTLLLAPGSRRWLAGDRPDAGAVRLRRGPFRHRLSVVRPRAGTGTTHSGEGRAGVGGALLVPNSLAIIGASFDEERRGRAIGTWAGFTGLTMILGPVLGGYLTESFSWRGVFFINVPLAVAVLAIT